jgi:4-amino-4-deoxy-L-arabinose transferase-like glycosyltransferase
VPGLPGITNQMTQHPPLYYGLVAGAARLVPGFDDRSFVTQVGLLRLLSAALLLPLPVLAAAAARRLGAAPPVATAAALLPLGVPQLAHVGASLNNDVLLVLLGAAVAAPLIGVARGDASRRTALVVGVLLGLALLTKALAVGLLVWAALAYVVALLGPARAQRGQVVRAALLSAAAALAVGGWWWVVNLVRYGTVQPAGTAPLPEIDTDPDLLDFTWSFLTRVTASTWGSFGWLEVPVPVLAQVAGLVVVLAGIVLFLLRRPAQPWARAAGVPAVVGFVLLTAIVYQQSLKNYLRGGYLAGLQGRYLFAFVAVLAAVVAVGLAGALPVRARRWAPLLVLAGVLALQGVGVLTALRGFWWPDGEGPAPGARDPVGVGAVPALDDAARRARRPGSGGAAGPVGAAPDEPAGTPASPRTAHCRQLLDPARSSGHCARGGGGGLRQQRRDRRRAALRPAPDRRRGAPSGG